MVLSKKRDFVREMEKDMEMCLWAAKWWSFRTREQEKEDSGCVSVWLGPLFIEPSM